MARYAMETVAMAVSSPLRHGLEPVAACIRPVAGLLCGLPDVIASITGAVQTVSLLGRLDSFLVGRSRRDRAGDAAGAHACRRKVGHDEILQLLLARVPKLVLLRRSADPDR